MVTRRPRVAFICNEETKQYTEEWAKAERRTLSNLIESIVEDAVAERKSDRSDKEALQFALEFIETLVAGQRPGLALIAKLAHETDLTEEDLLKLRDRLTQPNGGKAKNGT